MANILGTFAAMTDASSTPSPATMRRDFELLSRQRRRAELRLGRERARNARYAIAGAVGFALVLGFGIQAVWNPTEQTFRPPPMDAKSKEFAATRTGSIVLPTRDEEHCREVKFQNETGKFSNGRTVRCEDAIPAAAPPSSNDPNSRATAIKAWFNKR
jgi:hypothetical protein